MISKIVTIFLLIQMILANLIISVTSSSTQVGNSQNIKVLIRPSTNLNQFDFIISNAFTINNPICTNSDLPVTCSKVTPASGSTFFIRYSGLSLLANTNYNLTFSATNPPYADNFVLQGNASGNSFINTGTIQILPKQITCSMNSLSNEVGKSSNTTFTIGVDTLSTGSIGSISLAVATQNIFSDVINPSPTCQMSSTQYSCSLTQIFGQQVLSISNIPVGKNNDGSPRTLSVNTIRNPPFNSTFETITIQIKDSLGRDVEKCSVVQPAPSVLTASTFFTMENWGNTVGESSNINIYLTPSLSILEDPLILLVYPKSLIITPKAPAISEFTQDQDFTYLQISNASLAESILSFSATAINPSSVISLSLECYLMYNKTHFRQFKSISPASLILVPQILQVSSSLYDSRTLTPTTMNVSMNSPIPIDGGINLKIQVDFGQIMCAALGFGSIFIDYQIVSCVQDELIISTTQQILKTTNFWLSFRYVTHMSLQSNQLSISVSSLSANSIMQGTTSILTSISSPSYNISSSNATFTAISHYTFTQNNITSLPTSLITRVFTVYLPLHATLTQNTNVVVNNGSSTQLINWQVDQSANTIIIIIAGRMSVRINNILNPSHFQGGREWRIEAKDLNNFQSSISTSIHTPNYSPAQSKVSIQLSNDTIQQLSNSTLNFEPLLQYNISSPPTITVTFSTGSTIRSLNQDCPGCVLLTSTKFSFPYYGVVMAVVLQVTNNQNPIGNIVSFIITLDGFQYETGQITYELKPLQYSYTASFEGLYAELGTIFIQITSALGRQVNLTYSGTDQIFSSDQQCRNCNSTYLQLEGIVKFFQSKNIVVEGTFNGILYARAVIPIYYSCYDIPGCQICLTLNGSLICDRCFPQNFTSNYLLFQQECYSVCPASTYPSGVVCQSCPQLCYRCNQIQCLQCQTPFSIYENTCVLECPPTFIKNATHCLPRPVVCPVNCIDCPDDNVCRKCNGGYLLLENLCYSECPTGYIAHVSQPICVLFVPPQETDYFPFAFFIASIIGLITFIIIKCFQRRSLVMGNYITVAAFLEIGAIIMMISYTFISMRKQPLRWPDEEKLLTQALLFIILVTKVTLNVVFLIYFLRVISPDENFQKWLDKNTQHQKLYIVLLVFSSVFSFQMIRMIYSRLLGLELFYGRFNTSLIFKPLNFFSLAYIIPGGSLVVMAVNNIRMQDGYTTSIYYSSIEVILMEASIAIGCILEVCRSDKEYFDYQIYKVDNEHQESSASKINIMYQEEHVSNSDKLLSGVSYAVGSDGTKPSKIGKIRKNVKQDPEWRRKTYKGTISEEEDQVQNYTYDNDTDPNDLPLGIESNNNRSPSIFRQKILKDWQKIRQSLPKKQNAIYRKSAVGIPISKSPSHGKRRKNQRKMANSLKKIQIRSPLMDFKNKNQLKKHFYRIQQQEDDGQSERARKLNFGNQQEKNKRSAENSQINTFDDPKIAEFEHNYQQIGNNFQSNRKDEQNISQIRGMPSDQSFQKSLLQLRQDMKANRYDDFDDDPNDIVERKVSPQNNRNYVSNEPQRLRNLKKYKAKHVNRQTQAVYLQRLGSSEAPKRVGRSKRLDDF